MHSNSRYVDVGTKRLRTGYTTGSCAQGATKAALWMLINQKKLDKVKFDTPKGWVLILDVKQQTFNSNYAIASVIKDSGDDPDITNGIEIIAKVSYREDDKIHIFGGEGVGMVTRDGLRVEKGKSAINPVPMKMIQKEVNFLNEKNKGLDIEIIIPKGKELAKKTFNPKLGIEGGLSVLGTSGIVEPMSEDALQASIAEEIKIRHHENSETIVLTFGNIGEKFHNEYYPSSEIPVVQVSNYLGSALEACMRLKFKHVLITGHIGKLIKVAGGAYYTHNRTCRMRFEIFVTYLALAKAPHELLVKVMACTTTDEAVKLIDAYGYSDIYSTLIDKVIDYCEGYIFEGLTVDVALYDMQRQLGKSNRFERYLDIITEANNGKY